MDGSFARKIKKMFQIATRPDDTTLVIEKFDEALTPNMRAIRLAMSMADTMVAMGMPVADVVTTALDITDRYCHHKVQFDISSTLITASQDRGNEHEPLTMVHPSQLRSPNYLAVRDIQTLVQDIRGSKISLAHAEKRFDAINEKPLEYPSWLVHAGSAILSAGVGVFFGAQPIIVGIMFLIGLTMAYLISFLGAKRIPQFYIQVVTALIVTVLAVLVGWLKRSDQWPILADVNPTFIVIGGIVLLVAGLAVVGAVQDAIDEFYVTAGARLLKVFLVTAGIVAGVAIGLYLAKELGITIKADSAGLGMGAWPLPIIGAAIISFGYAITVQTNLKGLVLSGALGAAAIVIFNATLGEGPLAAVAASGIAAATIAAAGTLISRVSRTPSVALIMAGIVPLTPGIALYNALSTLTSATADDEMFARGSLMLFNVILIAITIAASASLGHLLGRPLRRTLVRARNALPQRELSS